MSEFTYGVPMNYGESMNNREVDKIRTILRELA